MNVPIEFLALFLGVALGVAGWVIKYMLSAVASTNVALKSMTDHLALLNGRMGKSETWQAMHERNEDERYALIDRRLEQHDQQTDSLWSAVRARS